MQVPLNPRSTNSTNTHGARLGGRAGTLPLRHHHDAPSQLSDFARSVARPTRCRHQVAPIDLWPFAASPRRRFGIASSRSSPSILSVGYATSPPESGGVAVLERRPNLGHPCPQSEERSVFLASLGLQRDIMSRHGSHATRLLRGLGTQSRVAKPATSTQWRRESYLVALRELPRERLMPPLGGVVQSGQSDIEATSGADPVSPRGRRPYMLAFQSRLAHHTPFAPRTGRKPILTTNGAQLDTARRRVVEPPRRDKSQVGRDRRDAPTGVRVTSGCESPPPMRCLTRNPTASATSRSLLPSRSRSSSTPEGLEGPTISSRFYAGEETEGS